MEATYIALLIIGIIIVMAGGEEVKPSKRDYRHDFDVELMRLARDIDKYADHKSYCNTLISQLREKYLRYIDKDYLDDSIGELRAMLENKSSELSFS